MKIGVTLPQFSADAGSVLAAARQVEESGLDGVFVFDHLWPLGQPDRPALSALPLVGALLADTSSLAVGTLVARIGLLPDDVLVSSLTTAANLAPGRFVAGLGTGDNSSRAENHAYGLDYPPASARIQALGRCLEALAGSDMPVWVGCGDGSSPAMLDLARHHGASVNLWGSSVTKDRVSELARLGPLTWGGEAGSTPAQISDRLENLRRAGAEWAVCAWPRSPKGLEQLARSARTPT